MQYNFLVYQKVFIFSYKFNIYFIGVSLKDWYTVSPLSKLLVHVFIIRTFTYLAMNNKIAIKNTGNTVDKYKPLLITFVIRALNRKERYKCVQFLFQLHFIVND